MPLPAVLVELIDDRIIEPGTVAQLEVRYEIPADAWGTGAPFVS